MGKLVEGKEFRNLLRLARQTGGTPFGREISRLGATQVDALIMVSNREIRDQEDASKGPNTVTMHFDDLRYDENFPEEI